MKKISKERRADILKRLELFKDSLQIVRTGRDKQGGHYNTIGTLNQAAWIGENSGFLIDTIEELLGE